MSFLSSGAELQECVCVCKEQEVKDEITSQPPWCEHLHGFI